MHHDIRALLDALRTAWNDGDAAGYAALFTEDADYITFFGLHLIGRQSIEDSHRELFAGPLRGSTMAAASDDARVRELGDGVVFVVSGGNTTTGPDPAVDPSRDSVVSFTAVRGDDGWRFASFQNTRVAAMGGGPR